MKCLTVLLGLILVSGCLSDMIPSPSTNDTIVKKIWNETTTLQQVNGGNNELFGLFSCNADSDCAIVDSGGCGCKNGGKRTAINKRFVEEWNANLSNESNNNCTGMQSFDWTCRRVVLGCIGNVCKLLRVEEEVDPGFAVGPPPSYDANPVPQPPPTIIDGYTFSSDHTRLKPELFEVNMAGQTFTVEFVNGVGKMITLTDARILEESQLLCNNSFNADIQSGERYKMRLENCRGWKDKKNHTIDIELGFTVTIGSITTAHTEKWRLNGPIPN